MSCKNSVGKSVQVLVSLEISRSERDSEAPWTVGETRCVHLPLLHVRSLQLQKGHARAFVQQ